MIRRLDGGLTAIVVEPAARAAEFDRYRQRSPAAQEQIRRAYAVASRAYRAGHAPDEATVGLARLYPGADL